MPCFSLIFSSLSLSLNTNTAGEKERSGGRKESDGEGGGGPSSSSSVASSSSSSSSADPSMEISAKHPERENPSPANSPKSNGGATSWSSSTSNGGQQPLTPKLIPRSESNPYPTTFVQADTTNFKQVVQMLTGSNEKPTSKPSQDPLQSSRNFPIPPIKTAPKKQQNFKLYERRNNLKNSLMINTLLPNFAQNSGFSPRNSEVLLSPSILDFPSLALSPVTPLNDDPFGKSSPSMGSSSEEEKAIAEKGFFLHPSPLSTPREADPQLLPLFPLTSPKISGSSS